MIDIFRKIFKIIIFLSFIMLIKTNKAHPPPRSDVNVVPQISSLFDPKDVQENKYIISNAQELLDKLLMAKHGKYAKKDIKGIVSDSISNWMRRHPEEMKYILNATGDDASPLLANPLLDTIAKRMNNYYNEKDVKKLKNLLKKIKKYIETNQDTSQIINELLNNAVFVKYASLNDTMKLELIEDLKMCSEFLITDAVVKGVDEQLSILTRKSLPNHNINLGELRNIDDKTYANLRRSVYNKLREVLEKNYKKKKNNRR